MINVSMPQGGLEQKPPVSISDKLPVIFLEYKIQGMPETIWKTHVLAKDHKDAIRSIQELLGKGIQVMTIDERSTVIDYITPAMKQEIAQLYNSMQKAKEKSQKSLKQKIEGM